MHKIRDVLRLAATACRAARSPQAYLSKTTIQNCLHRAETAGVSWPLPNDVTDETLEVRLYPPPQAMPADQHPLPDWAAIAAAISPTPDMTHCHVEAHSDPTGQWQLLG